MSKNFLVGASIAALMAIPAFAQPSPPPAPAMDAMHMGHGDRSRPETRAEVEARVAEHFARADANKDGAVTRAEFDARVAAAKTEMQAKMAEMQGKMFDSLDADKNGQVSRAEWDAHHAKMRTTMEHKETASADGKHVEKRVMMMHGGDTAMGGMGGMGGMGKGMMMRHSEMTGAWFDKADANKDGRVTLAEAKTQPLAHFDKADANKDGTLSPDERKAAHNAMRAEWRAKRGS